MRKADRLFEIIQILRRSKQPVTADAMAAELETSKFSRAKSLLHESELSSLEIADALGYADLSTFSHAFKRWSGMSPAIWRRSTRGRSLA